ncbi:hypothetical protein LOTGIDRAFT_239179 [Lottia gigantea]|uniref:Uncharacterized protein n=1 Tax=Lottia gigantea TaxID=225164 RepID=V4C681_LOTGI|nr:hypothetical protein LOTGIDRAFT_239179 [Lottia gigantea]ESO97144.1 hypothetical protein LOTGIDRAFT_239179 [Lottia gigantea]
MDLICYTLVLILTGNGVLSQTTTESIITTADLTATTASSDITTQSPSITDETTLSADSTATTASSDITTQAPASVTGSTTASSESTTASRNLVVSTEAQGIQNEASTRGPFFNQPVYTVPTAAPPRAQQPAPVYYTYPYTQQYQQVYQPQQGYNNIPYYYQPAPKPVQYYQPTSFYQQRSYYRQPSYQQSNNLFNMFYMMMFDLF